jgi:hypothetical protein
VQLTLPSINACLDPDELTRAHWRVTNSLHRARLLAPSRDRLPDRDKWRADPYRLQLLLDAITARLAELRKDGLLPAIGASDGSSDVPFGTLSLRALPMLRPEGAPTLFKDRPFIDETVEVPGGTMTITGRRLYLADWSVLLAVLRHTRDAPVGEPVRFSHAELTRTLGWSRSAVSRQLIDDALQALAFVLITQTDKVGRIAFDHLIYKGHYDEAAAQWVVSVGRGVIDAMERGGYASVPVPKLAELQENSLARWLLLQLSTHNGERPLPVPLLHRLSGSASSPKEFTRKLKAAAAHLIAVKFLASGCVKNGLLFFKKEARK